MVGGVKMLRRMFVLRRIAAAHMTTCLTEAQMNPAINYCQPLFTAIGARCHWMDLVEMSTGFIHDCSRLRLLAKVRSAGSKVAPRSIKWRQGWIVRVARLTPPIERPDIAFGQWGIEPQPFY